MNEQLQSLLMDLTKTYGPVILLLGYFVIQDYSAKKESQRRQKLLDRRNEDNQEDCESRIHKLEDYHKEVLAGLIKESNDLSKQLIHLIAKFEERHGPK